MIVLELCDENYVSDEEVLALAAILVERNRKSYESLAKSELDDESKQIA